MTPLRQRFIEDMQLRNFAPTTQRSYVHYVANFALHYNLNPELLDLEAVREYQLFLTQECKLSPQSVNTFTSAVQFLYLVTLEMPWKRGGTILAQFLGLDPHTVARGRQQLLDRNVTAGRTRRSGGGRKRVEKKPPTSSR
jgi:hypothetical protein